MEFITVIGFLMVMLVLFSLAAGSRLMDLLGEKEYVLARNLVHEAKAELTLAAELESGYNRTFTLPQTLEGTDYTISLSNSTITLATQSFVIESSTIDVSGALVKGNNTITKKGNAIRLN